ncbi:FYVE zinc finger-domain-containing protein [Mycena amicta]|nr:FYVE zinc finger-domain-containing protein [Mycena amicta]
MNVPASTSPASSASSILSTSPSCASLCSTRSTCSDGSLASTSSLVTDLSSPRPNEHLAVLLPRIRWKPDSDAAHCDNFDCRMEFTILERRHHCRKCGGVFCRYCSEQTTPLLDTSKLGFFHPPRDIPLQKFAGPDSPLRPARVCDDCYAQILGLQPAPSSPLPRQPRRPSSLLASPIALFSPATSAPPSPQSRCESPLAMSDSDLGPSLTRSASSLHRPRRPTLPRTSSLPFPNHGPRPEQSYGELDAYPLRRASLLCKATGGGRWSPQVQMPDPTVRLPIIGGRAPYELDMEREEQEERRRRSNPVVKHGDFQYRIASFCEPEPPVLQRVPLPLATF